MSLFGGLFKTQKTPSYNGPRPYNTLMDAVGGPEYYKKITDRSNGIGTGYSPDYVNQATNPVIARMRNQFDSYDMPALNSELTATGRRRGSSGFQQVAKAYQDQGLNEKAAYAPIYQQAEEANRADKNQGIQDLGAFNTGDYNARSTAANFEDQLYGQETNNIQSDRKANDGRAMNAINYATELINWAKGGPTAAVPTFGSATTPTATAATTPNNSYNLSPSDMQIMQRLISKIGQSGRVV